MGFNELPYEVELSQKAYYGLHEFSNRYNSIRPCSFHPDGFKDDIATHNHGLRAEIVSWINENGLTGIEGTSILRWKFDTLEGVDRFIKAGYGAYRVDLPRNMTNNIRAEIMEWYETTSQESIWRIHYEPYIWFDILEEATYCRLRWG